MHGATPVVRAIRASATRRRAGQTRTRLPPRTLRQGGGRAVAHSGEGASPNTGIFGIGGRLPSRFGASSASLVYFFGTLSPISRRNILNCNDRLRYAYGITVRIAGIEKRNGKWMEPWREFREGESGSEPLIGFPPRIGTRSSGTGSSPVSESGSIPRERRSTWSRAGDRGGRGEPPSDGTERSPRTRLGGRRPGSSLASRRGTSRRRSSRFDPSPWRSLPGGISGSTWRFTASRERGCCMRPSSAGISCPRSGIPRSRPSAASRSPPFTSGSARRPARRTGPSTSSPGSSTWPRKKVSGRAPPGTRPGPWRSTGRAGTSASSPRRSSVAWEGCWTRRRRARAEPPRRPSRPSASSCSPAAAGARSSGSAGSTSISGRAS